MKAQGRAVLPHPPITRNLAPRTGGEAPSIADKFEVVEFSALSVKNHEGWTIPPSLYRPRGQLTSVCWLSQALLLPLTNWIIDQTPGEGPVTTETRVYCGVELHSNLG